ncbi:hypothetical protein [Empedobacter tilapiae]
MKQIQLPLFALLFTYILNAQVKITDSNDNKVNENALLHLESKDQNRGFLLPRLSLNDINSPYPLTDHVEGMVIYNIATVSGITGVKPNLYLNDGSKWLKLTAKSNRFGDIKNSFSKNDTNGWYLLDGRETSTLPNNAKAIAEKLFGKNIPNMEDSYLKNKSTAEEINSLNGKNSFIIEQVNLPDISFQGITSAVGDHTHTYIDNRSDIKKTISGRDQLNPLANSLTSIESTHTETHSHTFKMPLGGENNPITYIPKSIVTNTFIYLGID